MDSSSVTGSREQDTGQSGLPSLISVHFPKAGGTSTLTLLRAAYGSALFEDYAEDPADPLSQRQLDPVRYMERRCPLPEGCRAVHGHFHGAKYLAVADAFWFTVLREPVRWMVSLYWFWRGAADGLVTGQPAIYGPLHEYVIREGLDILQTAALPIVRTMFTSTYFGDIDMSRFDFIGSHEHRYDAIEALGRILGPTMPADVRENVTPPRPEISETLADRLTIARLRDLLASEIAFYERWVV